MAVRPVSADALSIRAARAHTSPTVLKNLVADIARLREGQGSAGQRLRDLGAQLRALEATPADERGAGDDVRRLRQEMRELEAERRADAAMLKRKLEQLEAIRKGHAPEAVDEGKGLQRAEPETDNPFAYRVSTDLSSLNET